MSFLKNKRGQEIAKGMTFFLTFIAVMVILAFYISLAASATIFHPLPKFDRAVGISESSLVVADSPKSMTKLFDILIRSEKNTINSELRDFSLEIMKASEGERCMFLFDRIRQEEIISLRKLPSGQTSFYNIDREDILRLYSSDIEHIHFTDVKGNARDVSIYYGGCK